MAVNPRPPVPGMEESTRDTLVALMQVHVAIYSDIMLSAKHAHWNVTGPNFVAVHELIFDPIAKYMFKTAIDETSERIATLGGSAGGTSAELNELLTWPRYTLGLASAEEHLHAFNNYLEPLIAALRKDLNDYVNEADPVWASYLSDHIGKLDWFLWFIRAHLPLGTTAVTHLPNERYDEPVSAN